MVSSSLVFGLIFTKEFQSQAIKSLHKICIVLFNLLINPVFQMQ